MNDVIARLRGGRLGDTDPCLAEQRRRNRPGRIPTLAAEDCWRAEPAAGARLLTAAGIAAAGHQRTTGRAGAGGQSGWTSRSI